jgi:LacI family transcriptional regulator
MSLREIANHAKVSTSTASRVINGVPTDNRNLAKRVRKAIGEHGYSGNTQARCLVSGKSRLFGLVISDMRDPFFPEIVQSFEAAAIEVGCETLATSTLHDPKRMELSVRRMVERRIEGAAVLTFGSELNPARDEIYQPQEYLLDTDLVLRRSTALACLRRSGLTDLQSLAANSRTGEPVT